MVTSIRAFAGAVVEVSGDGIGVTLRQRPEVGAAGEGRALQPAGGLGAALPGAAGIAEAGGHAGRRAEPGAPGHLLALVPGDGPMQLAGQAGDGIGQGVSQRS
jgi:hypothetical protein